MTRFDAVIIGSGPAGVSAAFPLVEAGLRVLMIDPGAGPGEALPEMSYRALRKSAEDQWRFFVGKEFQALRQEGEGSPKFRAPSLAYVFAGHESLLRAETRGFSLCGSLASGGLSNAWGAGVAAFDAGDLRDFPFAASELDASFRQVAGRIGISGEPDDALSDFFGKNMPLEPPPALSPPAATLLRAFEKKPREKDFRIGRARNAVITQSRENRLGCDLSGMCLWGCARGAIYGAVQDIARLLRHRNFTHLPGVIIESIGNEKEGCFAAGHYRAGGGAFRITVPRLLLACGAIGTGKLVLQALGAANRPLRLLSNPSAAFALFFPPLLGQAMPEKAFGLSQLSFTLDAASASSGYFFGNLFSAAGLPVAEFIRRAPLSQPGARRLFRLMLPAMLVGNGFLSSALTRHEMSLRDDGGLVIAAATAPEFSAELGFMRRRLARAFRRCGAWLLPGSFSPAPLGSDVHYAGTVPMRARPAPHEAGVDGAVAGLSNVYVVDGAALSSLPAKPHTLTIMANADRIGRLVAGRAQRS
jgi:choline dehydrogenase-like flavoprotein